MRLSQQAILGMLQRECLSLAQELADKCDYEPAGMMLRLSNTIGCMDITTIEVSGRSLISEALADSNFTWATQRIRQFGETLASGIDQAKRVAA